jgi:hypothetical protein
VDRAILLFQTGKEEEGLARSRQALASAQSPDAKDEAQICVRAMEARLAAAKTNQTIIQGVQGPAGTNGLNGTNGANGTNGTNGLNGAAGTNGAIIGIAPAGKP